MGARSKARKRALDYLYAAELKGESAVALLEADLAGEQAHVRDHTVTLVRGVVERRERIDALLASYSHGWPLERMPAVDRNALRIGLYELLYLDDVPDVVAVDEAIALVRDLSTDDSPAFVNGVLDALRKDKDRLAPEQTTPEGE